MRNRAGSRNLVALGNRVRNRRQEINLSQEAMAERAEISLNTVSRIEGGQAAMSIEIFIKLVGILGVDANELLGIDSFVKEDGKCQEVFCRVQHLKQCDRIVVIQTMEALIDGMRHYR